MMKKAGKTHWLKTTILVLLICGVVGLALSAALFFNSHAPTYASAKLVFTFDGAARGIAPNGVAFDLKDMVLDEVLSEGLKGASLEGTYTPEQIRPNLVVTGVYPEDMAQQITQFDSLLDFGASQAVTLGTYHPTTFDVALHNDFDKSLSKDRLSSLLKSILDAYRAYFARAYSFGLDTELTLFTLEDYDYPQQLQILEKRLAVMSDYAQELYEVDPTFRLDKAGFNDISVRLNTLIDSSIDRLNADLAIHGLAKDPDRLIALYRFEIRSLNNRLEKQTRELDRLDKLVASYEKDEIIYLRTTSALTEIKSNSAATYDTLIERRKAAADSIADINAQLAAYELLLSDLQGDDAAVQSEGTPAADGEEGSAAARTSAAEAEGVTAARREQLEESIRALVRESEAILADFKAMLQAYNDEKINDLTVSVTDYEYHTPRLLSGAFIKRAIKVAGPIVVLGFLVCGTLIIISRKREEAQAVEA